MCHETTQAPGMADELLVAKQAAARLKVHVSTVYRLIDSGALRAHRLGGGTVRRRGVRIPASALDEYLLASQTPADTAA
ncbi:helix-turn-helix domain-containing protein [Streptomyces smyrnaeus]|uniref:helix-turn-helix domain-containing protein n=1 Tax=Streptomyces smyrnaeus TaxID=1387713 RepID=UPI0033DB8ACC